MEQIIRIRGSHGTTASRASKILQGEWKVGERGGRGGKGIYFWKECLHYIILAKGWYKQSLEEGRYYSDSNKECRVILSELEADEDQVLDLDDRDIRKKIYQLAMTQQLPFTTTRELSLVYDLFVEKLESKTGINFKLLIMEVPSPKEEYCPEYPRRILGLPLCCLVRDASCIQNSRVQRCET